MKKWDESPSPKGPPPISAASSCSSLALAQPISALTLWDSSLSSRSSASLQPGTVPKTREDHRFFGKMRSINYKIRGG